VSAQSEGDRNRTVNALRRYLPILDWGRGYGSAALSSDLVAAVIVTIMLIPQSLAYALLAGLPPQVGLYASILPLAAYAVFGTSRALAVGPVAVVSLMTAAAIGNLGLTDPSPPQRSSSPRSRASCSSSWACFGSASSPTSSRTR